MGWLSPSDSKESVCSFCFYLLAPLNKEILSATFARGADKLHL